MDYKFVMCYAVDFEDESYGIMTTVDGDVFVQICISGGRCCFEDGDGYYPYMESFLEISGRNMHLFVR